MKKLMKALVTTAYGNPEVLEVQMRPLPVLGKNEVLVKVHASAITRADTMMRQGTPKFARLFLGLGKPRKDVIGTGFSGEIAEVGEAVAGFVPGDLVFGCTTTQFGANAEYLRIHEDAQIVRKPEFLPHEKACTLADGALTSYHFIRNVGKAKQGERILIVGASGSLGLAALQIARSFGLHVTGVCSAANGALVDANGAHAVVAYDRTPLHLLRDRFDIVFDAVGGSSFRESRKLLKKGGRYITAVLSGKMFLSVLGNCRLSGKKARFSASGLLKPAVQKEMVHALLQMIAEGKLDLHVERTYTLEEASEAHRYVDSGKKRGNVVFDLRA